MVPQHLVPLRLHHVRPHNGPHPGGRHELARRGQPKAVGHAPRAVAPACGEARRRRLAQLPCGGLMAPRVHTLQGPTAKRQPGQHAAQPLSHDVVNMGPSTPLPASRPAPPRPPGVCVQGSAHSRSTSRPAPEGLTSTGRAMSLMLDRLVRCGEMPPCTHSTRCCSTAARGSASKVCVRARHQGS